MGLNCSVGRWFYNKTIYSGLLKLGGDAVNYGDVNLDRSFCFGTFVVKADLSYCILIPAVHHRLVKGNKNFLLNALTSPRTFW